MIGRMLSVHQDKPKCWHIAAHWEIEENNNRQNGKNFLLRGLHFHPDSKLLYTDIFKFVVFILIQNIFHLIIVIDFLYRFRLELDDALSIKNKTKSKNKSLVSTIVVNSDIPIELQKVFIIYEQAFKRIRDIKFIIELLNITQEYEKTEKLQNKIVKFVIILKLLSFLI
jgi:hypothetical protein